MLIDFMTLSTAQAYKTMSNTIFPRPVAWISTEDEGVVNLAPFSYFTPLSSKPPRVIVSVAPKEDGKPKDTFANIAKHKVCTISLAHKELLTDMKNTATPLPREVSECEAYGIEMKNVLDGFPPMVNKAKVALFCEFVQTVPLGEGYEPIILGVKEMYIDDACVDEVGHIHLENIGRVGMEFLVDCDRVK